MPATNTYQRGHTEVGHRSGSPVTDTAWGKTQEEGFQIQMSVTTVDLLSAQSKMEEDTGITRVTMDAVVNGIDGSLRNIGRMYGMPDSSFTGDVTSSTDEVLSFNQDDIGEEERHLYSLGPGAAASTRDIDIPRAKLSNAGPLVQSKTSWMTPVATWRILNPGTDPVLTITDDVA